MPGKVIRALVLIAASVGPAAAQATRAPLKMFDGLPAVQVSIDGAPPRWFVVDTGASVTTLSDRLARELGLAPVAPFEVETVAGTVGGARGRIASLRVGTTELGGGEVVWQPLARVDVPRQVDGILGFDRLSRANFLLDYRSRVLELDPRALLATTLRGERTPFVQSMGRPVVQAMVQVRNDPERRRRLVVDSGATAAVLIGRTPLSGGSRLLTLAGTAAAERLPILVRLGATTLASESALMVAPLDGATREDQGLLPASLFAWMYFDVDRGEILWKPAA